MSDLGETGSGDQADVACSDDRQLHGFINGAAGVAAGAGVDAGNLFFNSIERIAASEPSDVLGLAFATSW
jgi:hypothetical protein